EQGEPLVDARAVPVAVFVDGHPLDQLHDQIGTAVVRAPAVIQAGDVGMFQAGEDLPFGDEAVESFGGRQAGAEHFDGDVPLVVLVFPAGEIDGPHAAAADSPQQPVGTEAPA